MKPHRILIAATFISILSNTVSASAHYTAPQRGFGMGLVHKDSSELIAYISRESPLHDYDIEIGDEIVEVNGESVYGKDILAIGARLAKVESVTVKIRRSSSNTEVTATLVKIRERRPEQIGIGMIDRSRAQVHLTDFDAVNLDKLEHALDSLSQGSNGYSADADIMNEREREARAYLYRVNPKRQLRDRDDRERYQAEFDSYLDTKYGWHMESVVLDLHGQEAEVSPEALRVIQLFCREHQLQLIRQL